MKSFVSFLSAGLCAIQIHSLVIARRNNMAPNATVPRGIPGLPGGPWGAPPRIDPHTGDCEKYCLEWRDGSSLNSDDPPTRNLKVPWDHFVVTFDWLFDRTIGDLGATIYTQYDDTENYLTKRFHFKCPSKHQGWESYQLPWAPYWLQFHGGNYCEQVWMQIWRKDKWDNLWVQYDLGFKDNLLNVQTDPRCEVYAHQGSKIRCLIKYHFADDESTAECSGPGCDPGNDQPVSVGDDADELDGRAAAVNNEVYL